MQSADAAVVLGEFTATAMDDSVLLQWSTLSEINTVGFYIQRSTSITGPFTRVSPYFPSLAEEGEGDEYFWFDDTVEPDRVYYYRLEAIDSSGVSQFFGPIAGSVNSSLLTATPLATSSPALTATLATGSATPSLTLIPTSGVRTLTSTLTPFEATSTSIPATATQELEPASSTEPSKTVSPSPTKTLEPLPTIELIFPPTASPAARLTYEEDSAQLPAGSVASGGKPSESVSSSRLLILIVLVSVLWLSLGGLLVYLVRKLSD